MIIDCAYADSVVVIVAIVIFIVIIIVSSKILGNFMQLLAVQITELAGALDQLGVFDVVGDKPGFGYRTDIWCIDQ